MTTETEPASTKAQWRAQQLRARRGRTRAERARAHEGITTHLLDSLPPSLVPPDPPLTVCAYLPLTSEPLSPDLPFLLAARGYRVLVPISVPGEPLDWCVLPSTPAGSDRVAEQGGDGQHACGEDRFVLGTLGILEPSGARLGPAAIRDASVILVPALATDPSGFRLGRGGGFYDRSLALIDQPDDGIRAGAGAAGNRVIHHALRVAVVFDDEVDLPIPHAAHDAPVTHVVTPSHGLRAVQ